MSLSLNPFAHACIDGEVRLPGVVAYVVAEKGQFASIYEWTGDGTGRTREALRALRAYGSHVVVKDPGEPGMASRAYWDKMFTEGLVDEMRDAYDEPIRRISPEAHRADLNNAMVSASRMAVATDDETREAVKGNLAYSLKQCAEHIELRAPCDDYQGSIVTQFILRKDWARHEPILHLWHQYLGAGLIDPNERVPCNKSTGPQGHPFVDLIHPLEAAVITGNLDAFQRLLESGADIDQVPTFDWTDTINTRAMRPDGTRIGRVEDIHSLIWAKSPDLALAPLMAALVTEWAMARHIAAAAEHSAASSGNSKPRRAARTV